MTYEEFKKYIKTMDNSSNCPVKRTFEIFQGKWSTSVLFVLIRNNPQRFGSLKKEIPNITNTMLTSTLRELEERGLISRIQYNEIPPRVEYSLTEAGQSIYKILEVMAEWAHEYME